MKTQLLRQYDAGRRNFRHVNLYDCDLSWAYLAKIDLSYANLGISILEGIDLPASILIKANLSRTDLTAANLFQANLRGADLRGADLRGAELARANLLDADLRGASLTGADLSEAIMPDGTIVPKYTIVRRNNFCINCN